MSTRYRRTDDYDDYDYSAGSGPQRWDSSRFQQETSSRRAPAPPVIEQRPPYADNRRRESAPYYEDERYYERDRYDGRGGYERDRRYYEEEDYHDPRSGQGAMVPFRPGRPARPGPAPRPGRPGLMRRQSSVDRFDFDRRRETRRYEEDYYMPSPPRSGLRPFEPPPRRSRYDTRDYSSYDDVRIQDPDYYGDDGFREYREREWVRKRSKSRDPSLGRRPSTYENVIEERESVHESIHDGARSEHISEHITREKIDDKKAEKPYPRRGKTRMPKRLVHTKVLFDLGYPYYEEDEKTILIEKALGPDNIDEIFAKSKEYREAEASTTLRLEAPPPTSSATKVDDRRSIHRESIHEIRPGAVIDERRTTIREENVQTKPMSEAPRSVRDWDVLSGSRDISPRSSISRAPRRSRSHGPVRRDPEPGEEIIERRTTIIKERDVSPARTAQSRKSRKSRGKSRRSSSSGSSDTMIIEKRIIETDGVNEESASLHIGPLALIDRPKPRTQREIDAEIRQLELERRDLRRERNLGLGELREPTARGSIAIEKDGIEEIQVRSVRDRARSRSRPPSARLLKAMMYTAT